MRRSLTWCTDRNGAPIRSPKGSAALVPRSRRAQPLLDLLLALRQADDAADVLRRRQAGVGGPHDREVRLDVGRERGDLLLRQIDVEGHDLAGRGDPPLRRVPDLLVEV